MIQNVYRKSLPWHGSLSVFIFTSFLKSRRLLNKDHAACQQCVLALSKTVPLKPIESGVFLNCFRPNKNSPKAIDTTVGLGYF